MLDEGTYSAKAVPGQFEFSEVGKKKTPQVAVVCEVTDGPRKGARIAYRGFITEKAAERTFVDLKRMGWDGKNLPTLDGVGTAAFDIVVEHEKEQEGDRIFARVRWVNEPGGSAPLAKAGTELRGESLADLALRYGAYANKSETPF